MPSRASARRRVRFRQNFQKKKERIPKTKLAIANPEVREGAEYGGGVVTLEFIGFTCL